MQVKIIRESLRSLLLDELKASKILTRKEFENIAEEHGYVPESATRVFRDVDGVVAPVIKLNKLKKPIKQSGERIHYFRWNGGTRLVFKKK